MTLRKHIPAGLLVTAMSWTAALAADPAHAVEGAHDAAKGHSEQPFLLNVDLGSAVWNLVVFLLLASILYKFVWPNVLNGLRAREIKMRDDLLKAENAAKEAAQRTEELRTRLAEANREAQKIIDQSRVEAQRAVAEIKASADAEITQAKTRAEADIQAARQQAVAEIYEKTAVLATQVASKILQREISPDDQRQLIDESLSQLAEQARRN
ncbi:MAG: F0F1 ATP synthase subunit B [Phycisphaeraceae bacterium]